MRYVEHRRVEELASLLLTELGTERWIAESVSASLIESDLRGHDTHGIIRIATTYEDMIKSNQIVPNETPDLHWEADNILSINGNFGFGHLSGLKMVDSASELMDGHPVGVVGIRNASHMGRIGEWAEGLAGDGYVSLFFVNTGGASKTVAPPGRATRYFGTNPVAFGVPTFDGLPFPIVLDIATSQVSHGKITQRALMGDALPAEWTTSADGSSIEFAKDFEEGKGALLPLGGTSTGYKGFGLMVIAELLAGVVGNGDVIGNGQQERVNNSASVVILDPTEFKTRTEIADVIQLLDNYIESINRSGNESIPESDKVEFPGQIEHQTKDDRLDTGIPFSEGEIRLLSDISKRLEVDGQLDIALD